MPEFGRGTESGYLQEPSHWGVMVEAIRRGGQSYKEIGVLEGREEHILGLVDWYNLGIEGD